jgi:hypothetical protein
MLGDLVTAFFNIELCFCFNSIFHKLPLRQLTLRPQRASFSLIGVCLIPIACTLLPPAPAQPNAMPAAAAAEQTPPAARASFLHMAAAGRGI